VRLKVEGKAGFVVFPETVYFRVLIGSLRTLKPEPFNAVVER